jgi:DNA-binding protein H-NS
MTDRNLNGAKDTDKRWAPRNKARTVEDCAQICANRLGCTSFEFFFEARAGLKGHCGTYIGGESNIKARKQSRGWRGCLADIADEPEVTPEPVVPCPSGFSRVPNNLDGQRSVDKKWHLAGNPAKRTLSKCASFCRKRSGCTGFEYFSGPGKHHGLCGTYTKGIKNIITGQMAQNEWQSCVATDIVNQMNAASVANREVATGQASTLLSLKLNTAREQQAEEMELLLVETAEQVAAMQMAEVAEAEVVTEDEVLSEEVPTPSTASAEPVEALQISDSHSTTTTTTRGPGPVASSAQSLASSALFWAILCVGARFVMAGL